MNNERGIIAGEDLKPGDVVYQNLTDGKFYRVQTYGIKHGKLQEKPSGIIAASIAKNSLGIAYTSVQFAVYQSRKQRFVRWLKRFVASIINRER